jgi:hypothetical protein
MIRLSPNERANDVPTFAPAAPAAETPPRAPARGAHRAEGLSGFVVKMYAPIIAQGPEQYSRENSLNPVDSPTVLW